MCLHLCRTGTGSDHDGREILIGVVSDLIFSTNLTNNGPDTAYSVQYRIEHPTSLIFSRIENDAAFTCESEASGTICHVSSALESGSNVSR